MWPLLLWSTVIPLSLPVILSQMSNRESNPYANTKVFHLSIHLLFSRHCAWFNSLVGPRAWPSAGWNILIMSWCFFPFETFGVLLHCTVTVCLRTIWIFFSSGWFRVFCLVFVFFFSWMLRKFFTFYIFSKSSNFTRKCVGVHHST